MLVHVREVPKCRSTHISNYQSTERESYERDENYGDIRVMLVGGCGLVEILVLRFVIPLVVPCERRLHDTSPYLGLRECIVE